MAGRETADIVFCIDVSGSMEPTIKGVKSHVKELVKSLEADLQQKWDVRVDFLAYSISDGFRLETMNCKGKDVLDAVYKDSETADLQSEGTLFTRDIDRFCDALDRIECYGDESTIPAVDIAADFPFRDASTCHRAIVLLTDEAVATGVYSADSEDNVLDLAQKLQDKRIALYMTTPDCPVYDKLSQADRCEWNVDSSNGLKDVNFNKLMQSIGKSISVSQTSQTDGQKRDKPRPLFNESKWRGMTNESVAPRF